MNDLPIPTPGPPPLLHLAISIILKSPRDEINALIDYLPSHLQKLIQRVYRCELCGENQYPGGKAFLEEVEEGILDSTGNTAGNCQRILLEGKLCLVCRIRLF
jgi:hypothetical protein